MIETLKKRVPISDPNVITEVATRFEEGTYSTAATLSDYQRMISMHMLSTGTTNQLSAPINPGPSNWTPVNSEFSYSNIVNQIPTKSGSSAIDLRTSSTGQPWQHFPLTSALPSNITDVTHSSNLQIISRLSQSSVNNSMRQPQHQQQQNPLTYHQLMQSQPLKQKMHQSSLMRSQMQQQITQSSMLQVSSSLQSNQSNPDQQLGSQSNMSGMKQQQLLSGSISRSSNLQPHQQTMLTQMNSAHQHGLSFNEQSNSLQQDMQQRFHGSLFETHCAMNEKSVIQTQSTSINSVAQTGKAGATDWQEECYRKVQSMKEKYFTELKDLHEKAFRFQQKLSLIPPEKQPEQHERYKNFTKILDQTLSLLLITKDKVPVGLMERLPMYERYISRVLSSKKQSKIAQPNQVQQYDIQASSTPAADKTFSNSAANTLQANVGPIQASSSVAQLNAVNELNDLRIKHRSSVNSRLFEFSAGQRQNYYNQQLKRGAPNQNLHASLPQSCNRSSPRSCQSSSPQIAEKGLLSSIPKCRTPAGTANSPLIDSEPLSASPLLAEGSSQD